MLKSLMKMHGFQWVLVWMVDMRIGFRQAIMEVIMLESLI
jgi:hypothetical protein